MKKVGHKILVSTLCILVVFGANAQDDATTPAPESTEHRFPETTMEGKRAIKEKRFDEIVEKMEQNRVRLEQLESEMKGLELKGKSMTSSEYQKLLKEREEIKENDRSLENEIKQAQN